MHLRYRFVPLLATFCLALAITPALASKPTPAHPLPVPSEAIPTSALPACAMGQPDAASYYTGLEFFGPPMDQYFTLIDPATCPCILGAKTLTAHWVLNWPAPCSLPVEISIVGAIESPEGSGCFVPDVSTVLCGPFSSVLDGTSGSPFIDHSWELPCPCLTGKAFLSINMLTSGTCPPGGSGYLPSPNPVIDVTPDLCVSYNIYPMSAMTDLLTYGFGGNFAMWVDADCCPDPTRSLPGTWGKLKTLYR